MIIDDRERWDTQFSIQIVTCSRFVPRTAICATARATFEAA